MFYHLRCSARLFAEGFSDCTNINLFKLQPFLNTHPWIYNFLDLINLERIPHWLLKEIEEDALKPEYITSARVHFDQI